jgi:signal transduction histidine kinase
MINTVVRNLISNALKFTEQGGWVSISAKKYENFVQVEVEDNGLGIEKENIPRLFSLEESYSTKGTGDEHGTGLGLILCKDFIERNGGEMFVKSEPGKGSKFIFTLPAGK